MITKNNSNDKNRKSLGPCSNVLKIMLSNLEVIPDMGNAYAFGFVSVFMALHTARSYLQMNDPTVSYSFLNVYKTVSVICSPQCGIQKRLYYDKCIVD